jgi:hypothetical protein
MRAFLSLFFLLFHLAVFASEEGHKKLPESELRPLLENIKPYAIRYGEGKKEVHVFVDPMCPLSQEYMKWVIANERLQKRYTYYIHLYKLKKYDSLNLMRYIYSQEYRFSVLKSIMADGIHPDIDPGKLEKSADAVIAAVAEACERIDVYKRPYFIILRSEH